MVFDRSQGIYYGHLKTDHLLWPASSPSESLSGAGLRSCRCTRNAKLLAYPLVPNVERPGLPLGIGMTQFHVLVAYRDRVKAINLLDGKTVFSALLTAGQAPITPASATGSESAASVAGQLSMLNLLDGSCLGVCQDQGLTESHIWLFGSWGICHLGIRNEQKRISQIYLETGNFKEARRFCQVGIIK
ncbi:unnamed protein product [Protopolystoma xenopodis]|uniref:Pep3/Vps18 beta-propeller domain-containing protein n=1 Tax=Protopolystoma xenopodis TaxID=117903 RepID=A0A448XNC1_9PLAT|nr:unnamed protein product [Protopolystoma xenopodis]